MNRLLHLSPLMLLAVAGTAAAAEPQASPSITISLRGKTLEAVAAEVHSAAVKVCAEALHGSMAEFDAAPACVRETVQRAMTDIGQGLAAASSRMPAETVSSAPNTVR